MTATKTATIVDRVNLRDSAYFINNPTATEYVRPFVPGEVDRAVLIAAGVDLSREPYVLVTRIAPGIRSRLFLTRCAPDPAEVTCYAA